MPARRSSAEAEVREAVVARLRKLRPNARIIHEINVCEGGNRVDVLAVDTAEIIAVEIKSEKDKLGRLPDQVGAMLGVAHHVVAAIHEKFLVEQETNQWAAHYERDGILFLGRLPSEARGADHVWVFPERWRGMGVDFHDGTYPWREPEKVLQVPLPIGAIHMLWKDELQALCGICGIAVQRRATMHLMMNALRWNADGRQLTRGICALLRQRKCIEADPPIEGGDAK